jgi:anhydro-N-acetylmuramic acid kinase
LFCFRGFITVNHVRQESHLLIGLMSGTSADGIDAVAARISGSAPRLRIKLLAHTHTPFPPRLQRHILDVALHGTVSQICQLNFLLGEHFARAALALIRRAELDPKQIAAIASHGQTIHHLPAAKTPSTLQIGESAVIAERTGIRTIADFRVADMAAGGQGAPLVPFADWVLFTHPTWPRVIQNLGGIANLTFLPARAAAGDVIAFDTGPGNMVIDGLVRELTGGKELFDRNGRLACAGKVAPDLLSLMLAHPFLRKVPPKTTGREEFGDAFVHSVLKKARRLRLRAEDVVATATAFTAQSIADAFQKFVLPLARRNQSSQVQFILGGGGTKNPALRKMLQNRLRLERLWAHEDFGIKSTAKEALAFAVLAHATLRGEPSNLPSVTGARHPAILGKIVEPLLRL